MIYDGYSGTFKTDKQLKLESTIRYYYNRSTEAEELLKEIIPAAKYLSCRYNTDKDINPTFHCCDWSEWIEKINEFLGGGEG
jgi:hypothetical protein